MKVMFCKIAWMKYYNGITNYDTPINGGNNPDKWEQFNFKNVNGKYYGFVEPQHYRKIRKNICIDKLGLIENDKEFTNADYVDGVLIIWVALKEKGDLQIIGWYKNAKVYKKTYPRINGKIVFDPTVQHRQVIKNGKDYSCNGFGNGVNIVANAKDCCLLKENERNKKCWQYKTFFKTYGRTIWYPDKNDENYMENLNKLINQIIIYEARR